MKKPEGGISIITNVTVTPEQVTNLLTGALDGGSTYWARKVTKERFNGAEWASEAPMAGGSFVLLHDEPDMNDDTLCETRIDREACEVGLQVMATDYPRHFADLLNENDDACTADVFLQCICFGEVVYG